MGLQAQQGFADTISSQVIGDGKSLFEAHLQFDSESKIDFGRVLGRIILIEGVIGRDSQKPVPVLRLPEQVESPAPPGIERHQIGFILVSDGTINHAADEVPAARVDPCCTEGEDVAGEVRYSVPRKGRAGIL